jgi:hypothetical protein
MYLGYRFLPIRVRGIFSYPPGNKWITYFSMYPSTVKVGFKYVGHFLLYLVSDDAKPFRQMSLRV